MQELIKRVTKCEFALPSIILEACSLDFLAISPPRVGVPRRTRRNAWSSIWVPQTRTNEIPTVVDVDEIHIPKYE
jgi:hypothetical protein